LGDTFGVVVPVEVILIVDVVELDIIDEAEEWVVD
jgi:hypothetical protein